MDEPIGHAIRSVARPIHGEPELEMLADQLANARIVVLGESTCGTHELYDLRASITRRLIGRGSAALVIEADWPDAVRVDRYVRHLGDDESSRHALGSFERFPKWLWRNTDVVAMLDWLRAYNGLQRPERRAGFYGLDLYAMFASIQCVLSHLDEHDPPAARIARARYACFDHEAHPAIDGGIGKLDELVIVQLVEMQRRRAARSGRTPAGDAWWNAMHAAHVCDDAEAYYRTICCADAWDLRERHMADTIDMLAGHLGAPAKLVVWAHNSHVGDARATELADRRVTLGQLLRERHPGEVALVGFTTYDGTVLVADDWDEPAHREQVRPGLPNSWEALFHDAELPRCMMTAAALRRAVGAEVDRLERSIGVVYRPEAERHSHYRAARIADQFDVIVHVDRTRAVEPLDVAPVLPLVASDPAQAIPARN